LEIYIGFQTNFTEKNREGKQEGSTGEPEKPKKRQEG
jgi:hypothetical protein